jgi:hypothetical protein
VTIGFIKKVTHTKVILLTVPIRHDRKGANTSINEEMTKFNRKLCKLEKLFSHLSMFVIEENRHIHFYTYRWIFVCSSITLECLERFKPNLVHILLYVCVRILCIYHMYSAGRMVWEAGNLDDSHCWGNQIIPVAR